MGSKLDLQGNNTELLEILGIAKSAEVAGTPYTGDNPLTIGKDGYTFPERTLLKEGLEIVSEIDIDNAAIKELNTISGSIAPNMFVEVKESISVELAISDTTFNPKSMHSLELSNNRLLFTYNKNNSIMLAIAHLTETGILTSVTRINPNIAMTKSTYEIMALYRLNDNKVLLFTNEIKVVLLTIGEDDTITAGTPLEIPADYIAVSVYRSLKLLKLNDKQVFITYLNDTNIDCVYFSIITANDDDSITVSNTTALDGTTYAGYNINFCFEDDDGYIYIGTRDNASSTSYVYYYYSVDITGETPTIITSRTKITELGTGAASYLPHHLSDINKYLLLGGSIACLATPNNGILTFEAVMIENPSYLMGSYNWLSISERKLFRPFKYQNSSGTLVGCYFDVDIENLKISSSDILISEITNYGALLMLAYNGMGLVVCDPTSSAGELPYIATMNPFIVEATTRIDGVTKTKATETEKGKVFVLAE